MFKRNSCAAARAGKLAMALAAAVALAACDKDGMLTDDVPVAAAHYDNYPIAVAKGPVNLDVKSRRGGLTQMQSDTIRRFAQSAMSNRASSVHVRRPTAGGRSAAVADDVTHLLTQNGVPADAIVQSTYGGSAASPVLVSYIRAYAVTKECEGWNESFTRTGENELYDNFGCAQQHNIAAMVANPLDLETPRATTPSDPMRRSQVFTDYRTPKGTATQTEQADQIVISTAVK